MTQRGDREAAFLECDSCEEFIRHEFHEERETSNPLIVEEHYRCTRCGTVRVWGVGYRPTYYQEMQAAKRERIVRRRPSDSLAPVLS